MPSQSSSEFTVFECPKCGHWYGEREGLWSKPHHCPACIRAKKKTRPKHRQNITLSSDVLGAPMTVPVRLVRS